jgi:hypothetical protein
MQTLLIVILIGVGGWLIWDHTDLTKQLADANAKNTELTQKAEESQKHLEQVIVAFGKVAPTQAAEVAKRLDLSQGNPASAAAMSKLVPKPSAMEERRNKGSTLLDGGTLAPAGGRR